MADRIPIGTIPGSTSGLDDIDILIATLGVGSTVSRILLRQTNFIQVGIDTSVVGSIRNATGGGGDGIAFTIVDQTQNITVTGSLAVSSSESIYLRVSAGQFGMNLTGWVEVGLLPAAVVTTALTTLVAVKLFLGITSSTNDGLINDLIASVSDEIQTSPTGVGRSIIQVTATDEKVSIPMADHLLQTLHYPIVSIAALTENDIAMVLDTDYETEEQDLVRGQIARISGTNPIAWQTGTRVVKLTYDHGFAAVPAALIQAATELVAFDFLQSHAGRFAFGLQNKPTDQGGAPAYTSRKSLWEAQQHRMDAYRRVWV